MQKLNIEMSEFKVVPSGDTLEIWEAAVKVSDQVVFTVTLSKERNLWDIYLSANKELIVSYSRVSANFEEAKRMLMDCVGDCLVDMLVAIRNR